MSDKNIQRHCMNVTYARSKHSKGDDILIVKERLRDPATGKEKTCLRTVKNYRRPFWITREDVRAEHEQKREYELDENLTEYSCTQAELPFRVAKALGKGGGFARLSDLAESPYLYGSDITSSVLYMNEQTLANKAKNGTWVPDYSLGVMDFETNVHSKDEEIISGAFSFKGKAIIFATEKFMEGVVTPEAKMQDAVQLYMKKDIVKRDMKIKTIVVKNEMVLVQRIMNVVHSLSPDFLAFWNMSFDIGKILAACARYNVDPATVFSDPSIPREYQFCTWREDKPNRVTASGKKKNKDISETWNRLEAPSSFYIIDAMSSFRMLRAIEPKRHSYSYDAITKTELGEGEGKMAFDEVKGNHNISWHRVMQKKHKLAYCAYNLFDCTGVEKLDEKTGDLAKKIGLYADGSSFSTLNSNPKRLANAIHIYLRGIGRVICSTSSDMTEAFDGLELNREDWIVTLANELSTRTGIKVFEDIEGILSRISRYVYDVDITSGYPSSQVIANISKSTTLVEVCALEGMRKNDIKAVAVNLMTVPANAIDLGVTTLSLPGLAEIEVELKGIDSAAMLAELLKVA